MGKGALAPCPLFSSLPIKLGGHASLCLPYDSTDRYESTDRLQVPIPSVPTRIWQNQNRVQPCIPPASSRRCFGPPATHARGQRLAARRPPQDQDRTCPRAPLHY